MIFLYVFSKKMDPDLFFDKIIPRFVSIPYRSFVPLLNITFRYQTDYSSFTHKLL